MENAPGSTKSVLVLVEHDGQKADDLSLRLLGKGREIADRLGAGLDVLALGGDMTEVSKSLSGAGADRVIVAEHPALASYNAEAVTRVVAGVVQEQKPALFLLGYTFLGMEIGPAVSARTGISLLSNCTDIELSGDGLPLVTRPLYGEMVHVRLKGTFPCLISVQKGALPTFPLPSKTATVVRIPIKADEFSSLRAKLLQVIRAPTGDVDLTKANVIVAVGRGLGKGSNLQLAKDLAKALGGVVAASRPVIDMGWLSQEYLVGLSGKTVTPKVYIACGVSGAAQHVAGMSGAETIIAINKDPNAPIFKVAHYGLVGDMFEVIPALIDEAGRRKPTT